MSKTSHQQFFDVGYAESEIYEAGEEVKQEFADA